MQAVASRAHVPVVSVPEAWKPSTSTVVTAAVQDPVEAPALLRIAFEEARARSTDLVVLHAWWLASGYDVAVVDDAMRTEWAEHSRAQLEPALKMLRTEFPDVTMSVEVRHAPPIEAILDAAADLRPDGDRPPAPRAPPRQPPGSCRARDHRARQSPVLITPELSVPATRAVEPSRPYRSGALAAHS